MTGGRFGIQTGCYGDDTRIRVDREQAAPIVVEAVSDRIRTIRIGGISGDAHSGTHDGIFIHCIGGRVGITHRTEDLFHKRDPT